MMEMCLLPRLPLQLVRSLLQLLLLLALFARLTDVLGEACLRRHRLPDTRVASLGMGRLSDRTSLIYTGRAPLWLSRLLRGRSYAAVQQGVCLQRVEVVLLAGGLILVPCVRSPQLEHQ